MIFWSRSNKIIPALILAFFCIAPAMAETLYPLVVHSKDGAQMFQVELANTPETMRQGLMHRKSLAADHGMLFVFPTEQSVSFWMRNTLIPLDMVFIKKDGTIGNIHAMAKPLDESAIPSDMPVIAVLEIAGGQAVERGLKPGDTIETSLLEGNAK